MQPGQPDMAMIMQQAQKMQEQLIAAQAELASAEVTGQAGNGLVQVTMTAAGDVRGVPVEPPGGAPGDGGTRHARGGGENMGPLAGGLGGDMGGLGLPGF